MRAKLGKAKGAHSTKIRGRRSGLLTKKERRAMKLLVFAAVLALGIPATAGAQMLAPVQIKGIDSVFAQFDGTNRPGCALGVGQQLQPGRRVRL